MNRFRASAADAGEDGGIFSEDRRAGAPRLPREDAWNDEPLRPTAQRTHLGSGEDELSQRKHRFMTALLDRLKFADWRPTARATADDQLQRNNTEMPPRGPEESPRGPEESPRGDERRLRETMPSDAAAPTMSFTYPPGSNPLPRYTIRRGIGVGGFGEVYFAVSDAGKEVALKRIQRNLEVELRGVSHCLNLKHPHLVSLYDVCRDASDQAWVVMEYIAGPNLRQVLDDAPQGLPEGEVRRWLSAIGAGVAHLHASGLVHRDLKPGNVFDDLGIVKVGDYGLSKFISTSHRGGHTESVGTFHYMAPEIGRGEYGREIDIYALGVMLYELLTGQVPFDGESCHEIIVKHLTATPDLSKIAEPYRQAIRRALAKDPATRPHDVAELLGMLGISMPRAGGVSGADNVAAARATPFPSAVTGQSEPVVRAREAKPSPRPSREPSVGGEAVIGSTHDEPLARAVRDSIADLRRWWSSLDRSPGAKFFLFATGCFVLLVNTHWLLPLLSFVGIFYVPYYVVRHMVLHVRQQPSYAEAQRVATTRGPTRRVISKTEWRDQMRMGLRAKRSIHRVAELTTSWVAATITVLMMTLAAGVIGLRTGEVNALALAPYGWMMLVVLVASVGLLGMGKLWERGEGESLPRRLVLAGVGAGVGAFAYLLHQFLYLPTDVGLSRAIDVTQLPQGLYQNEIPRGSALIAHFAILFASLRWWKPVDPLRRTRLSLWSVAVAVAVEWLLHQVVPIPQPAGMLIAGGIAIAVQMAAPWINPLAEPDARFDDTHMVSRRIA